MNKSTCNIITNGTSNGIPANSPSNAIRTSLGHTNASTNTFKLSQAHLATGGNSPGNITVSRTDCPVSSVPVTSQSTGASLQTSAMDSIEELQRELVSPILVKDWPKSIFHNLISLSCSRYVELSIYAIG